MTSASALVAAFTTARITAFRPGASPPPVRTPIRVIVGIGEMTVYRGEMSGLRRGSLLRGLRFVRFEGLANRSSGKSVDDAHRRVAPRRYGGQPSRGAGAKVGGPQEDRT